MKIEKTAALLSKELGPMVTSVINNPEAEIETLLTDSRNFFNPETTLFFAINTPSGNNGHKYIPSLYQRGVRNFVVEEISDELKQFKDINYIKVPSSINALSEVGRIHRWNAKETVAITGSRGKTTLKEIIFQLLGNNKHISRSPRSFNSKIGVPLSLWEIVPQTDIALIEAGISQRGEMKNLSNLIQPDTVILTNVGEAHAQGFNSFLEKVEEKTSLASGEKVKTIIYSLDNKEIDNFLKHLKNEKRLIRWSTKNPEAELYLQVKEEDVSSQGKFLEYLWEGRKGNIKIKIEKEYDFENIAGALAFMLKEEIPEEEIKIRFESLPRINTRLNVSEGVNNCSIILDSYTSDLSSLKPAIDFMRRRKMEVQSQTLIMSDLRYVEEGREKETYNQLAEMIKISEVRKLIGIGETIGRYADLFPQNSIFFSDTEAFLKNFSGSDFNDEIILLKGSEEYNFQKIRERLEVKKHETVLEVNLDALLRNYNYFRSNLNKTTGIISMVKASGYGAGSYEIAKTLQDAGASYLAVAALDEGIELRRNGIVMPIMVMNPHAANYRSLFNNRLEPVIYSLDMLRILKEEASRYGSDKYPVHIKLDTGMHRMGFEDFELEQLIDLLKESPDIKVSSIFSHLATADCLDMDEFTYRQLDRFEKMSSRIMNSLDYPVKRHILNSAGILRFPEFQYELVRLGIGLYGANTLPSEIEKPLYPVSSLKSVIICIREISGDEAVGYGRKGQISGSTKIATLPVGYADGMNRKFGNGALKVFINGEFAPTIGNICMDATMIDITGLDCQVGDTVEIFGDNVKIESLAETLDTIPYEVLTSISPRVKRVYYRE